MNVKKKVAFILGYLTLVHSVAIAQPTLTANGINSVLGENFTLKGISYANPGSAGANQTWDISSISGPLQGLTSVIDPDFTSNGDSFSNANVAWHNPTSGISSYFKTSDTVLQNFGDVGAGIIIPYSNPEDILRFPCNFNDSFTDNWITQYKSGGKIFYRTGITTVIADGYGTLITPNKSYANVMRLHIVQDFRDSTDNGFVVNSKNDKYMWYIDGIHFPIAMVFSLTNSSGDTFSGGNYLSSYTLAFDKNFVSIAQSVLFPNPASDKFTITFSLTQNKNLDIRIFNIVGQRQYIDISFCGLQGLNSLELNIANVPEGIYLIQFVTNDNVAFTKYFIVER